MSITYDEVVEHILHIPRFMENSLESTREVLGRLGSPELQPRAIHIAGTNGKGSVSRMVSLILQSRGHRTGLFISPHLVRINERISIDGECISDEELVRYYEIVGSAAGSYQPAFFEYLFLMAAKYFADQGCDYVVYETGLGGSLDATNVIMPEVSIITSIGMDHMKYLGDTIEQIAGEKAGIIKSGIPVVYNTGDSIADSVIESRAGMLVSPCYNVVEYIDSIRSGLEPDSLAAIDNMTALYQKDNAYTAIMAATVLGIDIKEDIFSDFVFPGRMEYLAENILMDGAHNEDAIIRFIESVEYIQRRDGWRKLSLLFAVSSDKDYKGIIRLLIDKLSLKDVYITEISSDRRTDMDEVMRLFRDQISEDNDYSVRGCREIDRALRMAREELDQDTLLLIVGSLYMVGDIKRITGKDQDG